MNELTKDLSNLIRELLAEQGVEMKRAAFDVAAYAAARMRVLGRSVGQRGYEEARIAERDAIALYAGIEALDAAKAADARIIGAIEGALAIGARAISATGGL